MSNAVMTPQTTRVDRDHYPAWMDENPELFVKSVREFLDEHPDDQWECRVSKFAYLVRLTAIRKPVDECDRQRLALAICPELRGLIER